MAPVVASRGNSPAAPQLRSAVASGAIAWHISRLTAISASTLAHCQAYSQAFLISVPTHRSLVPALLLHTTAFLWFSRVLLFHASPAAAQLPGSTVCGAGCSGCSGCKRGCGSSWTYCHILLHSITADNQSAHCVRMGRSWPALTQSHAPAIRLPSARCHRLDKTAPMRPL
jgi:hypothetical protein